MLEDKDRIFTNLYGLHDWRLEAAKKRGAWNGTKDLMALGEDCARPGNQLPEALRAQIISLSIWVQKHTSLVIRREDDFEALIDINRIIMQGLSPSAAEAA